MWWRPYLKVTENCFIASTTRYKRLTLSSAIRGKLARGGVSGSSVNEYATILIGYRTKKQAHDVEESQHVKGVGSCYWIWCAEERDED